MSADDDDDQAQRENTALNFDDFWGDGSDHAMTWDVDTVRAQAEAAWDRSWAIKQDELEGMRATKDRLLERVLQSMDGASSEVQDVLADIKKELGET